MENSILKLDKEEVVTVEKLTLLKYNTKSQNIPPKRSKKKNCVKDQSERTSTKVHLKTTIKLTYLTHQH